MDIPSKNNNQSSLHATVPRNKVSNRLFNSDTVKDHVSTNDKDVSIFKKKDVEIPKKKDVDIPQNEDVNIPSVHVNIPPSQTNKPNYKPGSFYQYQKIVKRKLTLKINVGNNKNIYNVTLHKMK